MMHSYCQRHCGKAIIIRHQFVKRQFKFSNVSSMIFRNFRIPFDWKNPTRYTTVVFVEYVWTIYITVFVGGLLTLAVAAFFFEIAMITDIENRLNSIEWRSKSPEGRLETTKKISKFIEIHSIMKQLRIQL